MAGYQLRIANPIGNCKSFPSGNTIYVDAFASAASCIVEYQQTIYWSIQSSACNQRQWQRQELIDNLQR